MELELRLSKDLEETNNAICRLEKMINELKNLSPEAQLTMAYHELACRQRYLMYEVSLLEQYLEHF